MQGFGFSMHSLHQELMTIGVVTAFVLYHGVLFSSAAAQNVPFDNNYAITYGYDHVRFLNPVRSELQMSLDNSSGAGFGSRVKYGSGFFKMRLKLPPGDSAGVVTTFYLHSGTNQHDELDFEFLGNREGKPVMLQTNVFANGVGNREQRLVLWFDPFAAYHTYKILWNPHQIVFYIDAIPIRVYKNNMAIGVGYPTQPMQILGSIWNGDSWATDGGRTKINWAHAPFTAQYQGFSVDGCSSTDCFSSNPIYWWNQRTFWTLSNVEQKYYHFARKHINYDYCADRQRYPVPPPECARNPS